MKLINGRGLLGGYLSKHIDELSMYRWSIYHTWDLKNKQECEKQKNEYNKFVAYCENNPAENIMYISTLYDENNWYYYYKTKCEQYLFTSINRFKIIRFPSIISNRGVFKAIRKKEKIKTKYLQIISLEDCLLEIKEFLSNDRIIKNAYGERIGVKALNDIINM